MRLSFTGASTSARYARAVFWLAVGLFIAARLRHITAYNLGFDEIFSLQAARYNWSGLVSFVIEDMVHPPLFYLLLKLWVGIGGESLLWLRLFSVLAAMAAIVPFYFLCKELHLRATELNLALVLTAVNAFLIQYSQQLRMYSLLLLLTLSSFCLFLRLFNSPVELKKYQWGLFATNLLLVYTHYFGWLVVGVELILLLLWQRQNLRSFLISVFILAICFSPWVYAVSQVYAERGLRSNLGWIHRPGLTHIIAFYASLNGELAFRLNKIVGLLLLGYPILLLVWKSLGPARTEDKGQVKTVSWLLFLSFFPVGFLYCCSQLLSQSIWLARGLIIVAVPYMTLVAIAVHRLRPSWVRTATLLLVVGWVALAGLKRTDFAEKEIKIDVWVNQMIQMESGQANPIRIYTLDESSPYLIRFFLDSAKEERFQVVLVKGNDRTSIDYWLTRKMFEAVSVNNLTELDGDHFWVAFFEARYKKGSLPRDILMNAGYEVGEGFVEGPPGRRFFLFPVWRQQLII
jgi:uncharacterized membrane protein